MKYYHIHDNKIEVIESFRPDSTIDSIRRVKLWPGKVIESDDAIEQLILLGEITEPEGMKFDSELQQFRYLTDSEKYDLGIITKQEYKDIIKATRKARYIEESDPLKNEIDYEVYKNGVPRDCTEWVEAVDKIKNELPLPE